MSFPNAPHSGAPPPPHTAASFNAMLHRSRQPQHVQQHSPQPQQQQQQQQQHQQAPAYPASTQPQPMALPMHPSPQPPQPFSHGQSGPQAGAQPPAPMLGAGRPPASSQQPILPVDLPPQAFLTSSMLLDMVDKKVAVLLRDEKEYIGILRSYDQYANLVLTECHERITARNPAASSDANAPKWVACDVRHPGLMTVRGENVTICATVDLDQEDSPKGLKFVDADVVRALAAEQKAEGARSEKMKSRALKRAGFELSTGLHA